MTTTRPLVAPTSLDDYTTTPPCCPAWPEIRTAILWFVLDRDPAIRVLPHLLADDDRPIHERMIRLSHCPACGADRHMAIWNLDDNH